MIKRVKKGLSLLLALSMMMSMVTVGAMAEEEGASTGLCKHHTEHTAECGYKEAVPGAECTHECSEETGCVTRSTVCIHSVHDDTCGYVEKQDAVPCKFAVEGCPACKAEQESEKVYAAQIGEDKYESLQEAISAAGTAPATVELLVDTAENIVIDEGQDIELNIHENVTLNNSGSSHTVTVNYGGKLTITGEGVIANASQKAALFNRGTVILSGAEINCAGPETGDRWYIIANHGDMTIQGNAKVIAETHQASMIWNGYHNYSSTTLNGTESDGHIEGKNHAFPTLTITGGIVRCLDNTAIKNEDGGILEVTGNPEITGAGNFAFFNCHVANISGGTINGPICNYRSATYKSASGEELNSGALTITGGKFTNDQGHNFQPYNGNEEHTEKVQITGGTFGGICPLGNDCQHGADCWTGIAAVPDGYKAVKNSDDTYTVKKWTSSTLDTDIGDKLFSVGQSVEFTFTTTANDDAGIQVVGISNFSDEDAIDTLEYKAGENWYPYPRGGAFGGEGFPMADATSTFRVTFAKPGNHTFTAFMKTADGGEVLCSTEVSFTVYAEDIEAVIIGGKGYTKLQNAINAAGDGDTVVLLRDVEVEKERVRIGGKSNITLDGNGYTITQKNGKSYSEYGVQVYGCDNITLRDLKVRGSKGNSLHINAASVTIEGTLDLDKPTINVGYGKPNDSTKGHKTSITFVPGTTIVGVKELFADSSDLSHAAQDSSSVTIDPPSGFYRLVGYSNRTEDWVTLDLANSRAEARIGDIYYSKLQGAVAAAQPGDTVELLKDVNVSSAMEGTTAVMINKSIILDGGNHKISYPTGSYYKKEYHGIQVYGNVTVELKDLTIANYKKDALLVNGGATVTATNLDTEGNAWGAINVDNASTLNFKSGTLAEANKIWVDDKASSVSVPEGEGWNWYDGTEDERTQKFYTTGLSLALDQTSVRLYWNSRQNTVTLAATAGGILEGKTTTTTWTSSDETVATVDTNGVVTAVGNGTATITATLGSMTAVCEVTVSTYVAPTSYYTLTIHYVDTEGNTVAPSYTRDLREGRSYSVASPEIEGYTTEQTAVTGTLTRDLTVTVTYTAVAPAPTETAEPTESAEPTETPAPTESVEPTGTPAPSEDPGEDLEDPDTPLSGDPTEIQDPAPSEEPGEDLEDPDTPLADVPQTGDALWLWLTLTVLSAAGLAWVGLSEKKGCRVTK